MKNDKSRTYKSIKNSLIGFISQILNWVLSFLARALFIKTLGVDYLGIDSVLASLLTVFSLADLGFGTAFAYSLYAPIAENNKKQIARLMHLYRNVYRFVSVTILIAGIVVAPFLNLILKNPSIPDSQILLFYFILILNSSISYLFSYKILLLSADQKNYIVKSYGLIFNLLKVFLQMIALLMFHSYLSWLLLQVFFTIVNNLYLSYKVKSFYSFLELYESERLNKKESKEIISSLKSTLMYKISGIVINTSDNIIGSVLFGAITIGMYSNYYMIVGAISGLMNSVFCSIAAGIGNFAVDYKKHDEKMQLFYFIMHIIFLFSGLVSVLLFFVIDDFIGIWLGTYFILPRYTTLAVIANFYLSSTAMCIWLFRDAIGMFKEYRFIGIIMATINVVLSIILGIVFGFVGVLIATIVSRITTVYWYEPLKLFNLHFKSSATQYFVMRIKYAAVFLASVLICNVFFGLVMASFQIVWLGILIKCTVVIVVFLSIFMLVFCKDNTNRRLWGVLSSLSKKFVNRKN